MLIRIDANMCEQAARASPAASYSGMDEFMANAVGTQIKRLKVGEVEEEVADRLRGSGYVG